jgi:aspartate-semialdehyde dehydrogenase
VSRPLRVAVVGATGALGSEVLAVLSESSLAVAELVPVATNRSLGSEIEFRGDVVPVETDLPALPEADLVFLCTPAATTLALAEEALRSGTSCIDVSGTLAAGDAAPLAAIGLAPPPATDAAPLVATPPGAALACALALAPLAQRAGLLRVVVQGLEAASHAGRQAIESLYQESIAIFNQAELPEPEVFGRPVAFDCLPALGEPLASGATLREEHCARALAKLVAGPPRVAVSLVQVPAFVGFGASLAVETAQPLDAKQAAEALAGAPGVELWRGDPTGPSLRAAAGRDVVLVGRVRRDPSREAGLLLWLASDVLRLAAANAVQVALARMAPRH